MGVRNKTLLCLKWEKSEADMNDRLTEMAYTLVRLFQRFSRVERYYTDDELITKAEIVMQPGNGIKVGLWEAITVE
jgi:hypothetical protein